MQEKLEKGDTVKHRKGGTGTVESVKDDTAEVSVDNTIFDDVRKSKVEDLKLVKKGDETMTGQLTSFLEQGNYNNSISTKCLDLINNKKYQVNKSKEVELELISLYVKKVLTIEDQEIDFSDPIQSITGPNGEGKTLLAKLIRMLIFGNDGADVLANLIKRDSYIKLQFRIDKQLYKLVIEKKDWVLFKGEDSLVVKDQTNVLNFFREKGVNIEKTKTREQIKGLFERCNMVKDRASFVTNLDPTKIKLIFLELFKLSINTDLIKEDVKLVIGDKEKEIERNKGKIEVLESEEGIHTIEVKINELEKELKDEQKLKDELLNIATDGTDIIAKKLEGIGEIKKSISEKEEIIGKVKTVNENKSTFSDLKKVNEFINDRDEKDKKINKEIQALILKKDSFEERLNELKESSGKCIWKSDGKCTEISDVRKEIVLKERQSELDDINKKITNLESHLNKKEDQADTDIDKLNLIIQDKLNPIKIKNDSDIKKILDKYNIDDLNKEMASLGDDLIKKQKDYAKLLETDTTERKKELETKLETITKNQVEIGTLQQKKIQLEESKKNNQQAQDEILRLDNEIEEYKKIEIIFNRVKAESFPVWFLNENKGSLNNKVNDDFQLFKKFNKTIVINEKFKITVSGHDPKGLSTSGEKILNTILHYHILLEKFGKVPFLILDDFSAVIEPNTLKIYNEYVNSILENIHNLILTDASDLTCIKVENLKKI